VSKEPVETSRLMFRQTTPPPPFGIQVSLSSVLRDLAVDLASGWRLLVRVLLDQGGLEFMVGVCTMVSVQGNVDSGECTYRRGRDLPSTIFLLG
jgi:hypothetical protein